uniref:Zgc:112980 n=1 Tax=Myripristis murdjan TaxID=586833 RepID=A0A667WDY7_9TELE
MTMDNPEIIILSDDEEELCSQKCNESSVLIVEMEEEKIIENVTSHSQLDEDLVVTFSRRAEVLPHARYDCPIHPFTATDCETSAPAGNNELICNQCFCYICDKLASACAVWHAKGLCHCNSHKRSDFWSSIRNSVALGYLETFNLTLSEIDTHLRHAEKLLQRFRAELAEEFTSFTTGKTAVECGLSQSYQQGPVHDYTRVYECVSSFLSKADAQEDRAAAIMKLGAACDFMSHFHPSSIRMSESPIANATEAKAILLQRVVASVQKQMVMADFTPGFMCKLQHFYQRIPLPPTLKNMRNSLCVRPWDDVLLVSVLRGQNVTGVRKDKGKKDVLIEQISVVLLRTEFLQRQRRYRELGRYLKVVQSYDSKVFKEVRDLIPLFLCKAGDFSGALNRLSLGSKGPVSRFSPHLFLLYLSIFDTATAPMVTIDQDAQLISLDATWEPIKDAVPLKRFELVRFALGVQRCCSAVYHDSQCWAHLLTMVNTPHGSLTTMPEPNATFLQEARNVVRLILHDQDGSSIQIPKFFHSVYPDQALLLLVTEALVLRLHSAPLSPVLPLLNTLKKHEWALEWLWKGLSLGSFYSLLEQVTRELEGTQGQDTLLFPRFISLSLPNPSSSPEMLDHSCRQSSSG